MNEPLDQEMDDRAEEPQDGEDFAAMLENYTADRTDDLRVGDRVTGRVIAIGEETVFVDTGSKIDGAVDRAELLDENGALTVAMGDTLSLFVVALDESEIRLSKAIAGVGGLNMLQEALDSEIPVEGKVRETCKGGFVVEVLQRRAFCPLSQAPSFVDASQIKELGLSEIQNGFGKQTGLKSQPREGKQDLAAITDRFGSQKITGRDFDHLVSLARLKVSSSEAASLHKDLNAVLDYVETLKNLDTHDVAPMSHVLQLKNAWREDEPVEPGETEGILSKAPKREDRFFRVPKII